MATGPGPFSDIGKKAKDLLTKDYNFDQKFTLTMLKAKGGGITATGVKKDQLFVGDINTQYKCGTTTVDVKVDTSSKISTTVAVSDVFPRTRVAVSFKIPDHKSSKLEMQYNHAHAAIGSSIGLTPNPLLEFSAAIGSREISLGGEVGFDTKSATVTKCNAGIGINKHDFSASLIFADKGETLKASYIHILNPITGAAVAAEMTHKLTSYKNAFTIGSYYALDPFTTMKARVSHSGKTAVLCQHEWRPKSLITVSAEYNPKAVDSATKFGLALSLKP